MAEGPGPAGGSARAPRRCSAPGAGEAAGTGCDSAPPARPRLPPSSPLTLGLPRHPLPNGKFSTPSPSSSSPKERKKLVLASPAFPPQPPPKKKKKSGSGVVPPKAGSGIPLSKQGLTSFPYPSERGSSVASQKSGSGIPH